MLEKNRVLLILTVGIISFSEASHANKKNNQEFQMNTDSACASLDEEMGSWKVSDFRKHKLSIKQFEQVSNLMTNLPEPTEDEIQNIQKELHNNFSATVCETMQKITSNRCKGRKLAWIQTLIFSAQEAKKQNEVAMFDKYKQALKTEFLKKRYSTMLAGLILAGYLEQSLQAGLWAESSKNLEIVQQEKKDLRNAAQDWQKKHGKIFDAFAGPLNEACMKKSPELIAKTKGIEKFQKSLIADIELSSRAILKLEKIVRELN